MWIFLDTVFWSGLEGEWQKGHLKGVKKVLPAYTIFTYVRGVPERNPCVSGEPPVIQEMLVFYFFPIFLAFSVVKGVIFFNLAPWAIS